MTQHSDQIVLVLKVLGGFVALLILILQFCQFHGCRLPTLYNHTELRIMFRPIQSWSRPIEYGETIVGTKPLICLRNDIIDCMNSSHGGMLVLCAPFGHGKTVAALGASLGRLEGMPQRVLYISRNPLGPVGSFFTDVKRYAGIPLTMKAGDAANHLVYALRNKKISTVRSRKLHFLEEENVQQQCDALSADPNYGLLIIEDYNPDELKGHDKKSTEELKGLLKDLEAYLQGISRAA